MKNTPNFSLKKPCPETWRILVIDDDQQVHKLTKMMLQQFSFENKTLEIISAYSAAEAKELIANLDNIALIFLDVVMESDDAGLQFVNYIRNQIDNKLVRIILRTGQPGMAPEEEVIFQYDIDGYAHKTQITPQALNTLTVSSLRAYR